MTCKDSDVFALEGSIDKILSNGGWKGANEIKSELTSSNESEYKHWMKRKQGRESEEFAEELFYGDLMDRMCSLFPMKYMKSQDDANTTKYARTLTHKYDD